METTYHNCGQDFFLTCSKAQLVFYVEISLLPKLLRSHTRESIGKLFHVENFNGEAFSLKEIVLFKESIGF